MVFRRRDKRTAMEWLKASVYPKGGWLRAAHYIRHRVTRLPDPPHRVARGIFAGVFISFTPLFGLHFLGAVTLAFVMRGNLLAAILATFVGNPVTFPLIAVLSIELGHMILGYSADSVPASHIVSAFSHAGAELWFNIKAVFAGETPEWGDLRHFYYGLFKPYLVGGLGPGVIAGLVGYYISLPVISAYQKLRQKRRRDRAERKRERTAVRLLPGRRRKKLPVDEQKKPGGDGGQP